jgi:predicted ATPase
VIELDPLSKQLARQLLVSQVGAPLDLEVEQLALCHAGGNPLFLKEIGRCLQARRSFEPSRIFSPPSPIEDAMRRHIQGLPVATLELLQVAALIGDEFDARRLAEASRNDVRRVLDRLTPAIPHQVLRPLSLLEFSFAHPLLPLYLRSLLSDVQRREWHWALGSVMAHTGPMQVQLSRAAHHLAEGVVSAEQAREATRIGLLAAAKSLEERAYARAADEYARTFELSEHAGVEPAVRVDMATRAVSAWFLGGLEPKVELVDEAFALARQCADPVLYRNLVLEWSKFV